jgi:hypothetical protein
VAFSNATMDSLTLSWNASIGATGYRVDVASDANFSVLLINNQDVGGVLTVPLNGLAAGTTYYGRVRAYNANGTSGNSAPAVGSTLPNQQGNGIASYNLSLQTVACTGLNQMCDSTNLLTGRGNFENLSPNTIGSSCSDGTGGAFQIDESLDRLKITSLSGPLQVGGTVQVDATVWSHRSFLMDSLDLYYATNAASPVWTYLTTLKPTQAGQQTLTTFFNLQAGSMQAIRGIFRFQGAASPCTPGLYNDHDDLVFQVQ